jgi:hypothetical protein
MRRERRMDRVRRRMCMANEIERRYGERGLHANSLMPEGIMTGLQVHFDEGTRKQMGSNLMCKSPE